MTPEVRLSPDEPLRVRMGRDVRWFMENGTGIGVSTGVVRNTGYTPTHADPVRIASYRHWPIENRQAHVRRYFSTWTEAERVEFCARNGMAADGWTPLLPASSEDGAA
jgi:hypothetical protein